MFVYFGLCHQSTCRTGQLHHVAELLEGSSLRVGALLAEEVLPPNLAFVNLELTRRRSTLDF